MKRLKFAWEIVYWIILTFLILWSVYDKGYRNGRYESLMECNGRLNSLYDNIKVENMKQQTEQNNEK